jgi:hypothetical protein
VRQRYVWLVAAIGVVVAALNAAAQEPAPITSDRPDETESAVAVDPGYVQFELGSGYVETDDGRVTRHKVPESVIRVAGPEVTGGCPQAGHSGDENEIRHG